MSLKENTLKYIFQRFMAWRFNEIASPAYPILLEYPINPAPRWGYDKPVHPQLNQIIEANRLGYQALLKQFSTYLDWLRRIPLEADARDLTTPYWRNSYFSRLDAISLYCLLVIRKPPTLVEVGSGNSTRFARRAITDHSLSTRLISIDPLPRAEVDTICDEVIRSPLESVNLDVFDRIQPGDFVFIDNSHRSFTNSDVTTFFLDVLPNLPSGVVVHVHDIFIPLDYPEEWSNRHYSEQYLLACYLLGARGGRMPSVLLPNAFVSFDEALRADAEHLWSEPVLGAMIDAKNPYGGIPLCHGTSFWFELT